MKKFLFGLFTFSLGLVIGIVFKDLIFKLFPENVQGFEGPIMVVFVVVLFGIWWLAEKIIPKDKSNENPKAEEEKERGQHS